MRHTKGIGVLFLAFMLLFGLARTAASQTVDKQMSSLSGRFHIIWGDRAPDDSEQIGITRYGLVDSNGTWIDLAVDENALSSSGGPLALNRQPVVVEGHWERHSLSVNGLAPAGSEQGFRIQSIRRQSASSAPVDQAAPVAEALVSGSQRWVTVLCRFADSPDTTPQPKEFFDGLMLGTDYPGMDHYWRELSYNQINLLGGLVVGWYNLPQPRSSYVRDLNGDGVLDLDHWSLAYDCTAAAEPDVYFPDFTGINMAFNENLDCCAWGGSVFRTLDSQSKMYRITWLPPWGYENQGVIGHEMGHGFGLPHSSGPYNATYDSRWDVMSSIWGNCSPPDVLYGCVGVHTISFHKDLLGWIPADRRYVVPVGASGMVEIERLGEPLGTRYLIAKIPIADSLIQFYTVEVRQRVGYDSQLPGDAVVIHLVSTNRYDRDAQVVDSDGNGNPNDAGAMWLPGETFIDARRGVTVSVVSATPTGFFVEIRNDGLTPTNILRVSKKGNGTVTSVPAGIICGNDCLEYFVSGTVVTLAAVPDAGWVFGGWSAWNPAQVAECADGQVAMTDDFECIATFVQGPDLTGQFTSVARRIMRGRELANFSLSVRNDGNLPATGSFSIAFYLSDDGSFDGADISLLTKVVRKRGFAPGAVITVSGRVILPGSGDGKYLFAVIDSANQVSEISEGNNIAVAPIPQPSVRR